MAWKFNRVVVGLVFSGLVPLCGSPSLAEIDWSNVPLVAPAVFQSVTSSGDSAYTGGFPLRMQGILLNEPGDLLDATPNFLPATPDHYFNMGGQWQVYLQSPGSGGGGTGAYLAQNYGNLAFIADTADNYSNAQWLSEVSRVSRDAVTGVPLHAGDFVEIRARAGLFYNGEFNVNEAHFVNPAYNFDLVLLQGGYGVPAAASLPLSALKNSDGSFRFDPTRASGGELYQGTLVKFSSVHLVSPPEEWKPLHSVMIADDAGLTFPLLLGSSSGFLTPPGGTFDVTGILSQDDGGGPDPYNNPTYQGGYRLWIADPAAVSIVPEPAMCGLVFPLVAAGWAVGGRTSRR